MKPIILMILAIVWGCSSQRLSEVDQKELLVYVSNKDGDLDLYTNEVNGKNEKHLTNIPGLEWHPQYISESNMIVYNTQNTSGYFKMRSINKAGKSLPFETLNLPEFELSPNRTWVAFSRGESFSNVVIAQYASPTDSIMITSNEHYNGRPVWSHSSNHLMYISNMSGSYEVYIYDLVASTTFRVTENNLKEKYTAWSPDDMKVAVTMSEGNGPADIYIIDLESLEVHQLTDTPINVSEISWSLSGEFLAYHAESDGNDDIFILEISTGSISKITDSDAYYGEPIWVWK